MFGKDTVFPFLSHGVDLVQNALVYTRRRLAYVNGLFPGNTVRTASSWKTQVSGKTLVFV